MVARVDEPVDINSYASLDPRPATATPTVDRTETETQNNLHFRLTRETDHRRTNWTATVVCPTIFSATADLLK